MVRIAVIALFAIVGRYAGQTVGVPIAGAGAGGYVGLVVGFALTYRRYRDL